MFQFTRPGGRDLRPSREMFGFYVSIHAPGWARPSGGGSTGGDSGVSIHAPGWARQQNGLFLGKLIRSFNSRARVGATGREGIPKRRWRFQFTRPGGRDWKALGITPSSQRFNSRARVGATHPHRPPNRRRHPFQFTRPGGRDSPSPSPSKAPRHVSIHAPGWARPQLAKKSP